VEPSTTDYTCDCEGFKTLHLERMCVRCLDGFAEALPVVLSGPALEREMRHVAACLKRIVEADPLLGEQYVFCPVPAAGAGREN
jgi:hypothetical protein